MSLGFTLAANGWVYTKYPNHKCLNLVQTLIGYFVYTLLATVNIMKPYADLNGKAKWSLFWGDKVKKKIKKIFKKSARKKVKLDEGQD